MTKKFYGALDAAEYASTLMNRWKTEGGDTFDMGQLHDMMGMADEEDPLDEDDENIYYIVADNGAIGITHDNGMNIYWMYRPVGSIPPPASMVADSMAASSGYSRPRMGYSERFYSPEFQEAIKKNKKANKGCAIALMVAPPIVVPIYAHFSDDLDMTYGLLIGLAISAFMALIFLITTIKSRFDKSWEGTVIDKKEKYVRDRNSDDDDRRSYELHRFVYIRKDNGRKHKIDERATNSVAYHYFRVGDKVLYHARTGLMFPYEKYDKSRDTITICPFCRSRVEIGLDNCPRCKKPQL